MDCTDADALKAELEATKDELFDAIALLEKAGIAFDSIRENNRKKGLLVSHLARGRDKARDDRLTFEHRAYAAEAKARIMESELAAMTRERDEIAAKYADVTRSKV